MFRAIKELFRNVDALGKWRFLRSLIPKCIDNSTDARYVETIVPFIVDLLIHVAKGLICSREKCLVHFKSVKDVDLKKLLGWADGPKSLYSVKL